MNYGLYIHIPFCIKKCAYCDFVSASGMHDDVIDAYFSALMKEIEQNRGICVDSIFVGGGTPSSIDAKYICELFECINKNITVLANSEITLEANPGTLTKSKLDMYKKSGINRISLGVQSMQNSELHALGRIHGAQDAVLCAEMIKAAGFENYNLDLMLAIPHQTIKSLDDTLNKIISLSPTHVSAYSLIIEDGTPFHSLADAGRLALPDEDTECALCDYAYSFLEENGYVRYEISNFAKPGFESRHNLKYWNCLPYIGAGCGAHSYDTNRRYFNTSDIYDYIKLMNDGKSPVSGEEILDKNDKINEYIIMSLRLSRGIIFDEFYDKFGFRFEEKNKNIITKYAKSGYFDIDSKRICFTKDGFAVSNSILAELI